MRSGKCRAMHTMEWDEEGCAVGRIELCIKYMQYMYQYSRCIQYVPVFDMWTICTVIEERRLDSKYF